MQNKHGMQGSRSDTTVCTETHVQKTGREQKGEGSVKSKRKRKEALETVIYTLPAIVLVTIMMYIPFVMSGYYSLTKWNGIAKDAEFIGLENFRTIFLESSEFKDALLFTGKYTVLFMVFSNVFALALAVCLTKKLKIANVLRGVFFIPYIMGWGVWNLSWLGDPKIAFFSVVMVGIWQSLGFYIVLYIAGLQALPTDVLEAAVVDGASNRQRFFKVTLPLLGPSITTCVFMSLTNGLKVFDIILALTKGGPGASTYSVTLQIYKEAFQNNHYGLGSAESIIYFLVVLVVTQFVLKLFSSREVEL